MRTKGTLLIIASVAITWWWMTLQRPQLAPPHVEQAEEAPALPPPVAEPEVSSLSRASLREALSGDTQLIIDLLKEWQVEGFSTLDSGKLERAELLAQQLLSYSDSELAVLRDAHRMKTVIDETGSSVDLTNAPERFLPQTYSSATVLLALADSDQIVALPKGLRDRDDLLPKSMLSEIPLDSDRYNSEALYNKKPDVAFVASYSLPSTTETLRRQGLQLFSYSKTDAIDEVIEGMLQMGHVVNRPLKSELMALFIEAALVRLDALAKESGRELPKRPLYLNAYASFSTPTPNTIPVELLARLGCAGLVQGRSTHGGSAWRTPITFEEIQQLNPDCIVVSSAREHGKAVVERLLAEPALATTDAVKNRRVVALDESVQVSPSQYVVLAYYDLIEALLQ